MQTRLSLGKHAHRELVSWVGPAFTAKQAMRSSLAWIWGTQQQGSISRPWLEQLRHNSALM